MSKKAYLIFDFDGTLVNSFDVMITKILEISETFGCRKVHSHEIESLRDLSSLELIKNLQIPFYKVPAAIYQVRKLMAQEIVNLKPFPELPETLHKLVEDECKLGILTSNSKENVSTWLLHHNLHQLFEFIHNESNFFGKHRVLKKLLNTYGIDRSRAYYIGDETRDIDAARMNHITSVAVTWGFNSEHALAKLSPNFIIRKPIELLNLIS